jgi:hypothetical protein
LRLLLPLILTLFLEFFLSQTRSSQTRAFWLNLSVGELPFL